jgi:carboxylesterase
MKQPERTASTGTLDPAQAFSIKGSGDAAVLLIHGFTGIPHELRYLAGRLAEKGYSVSVPRLPGHGTDGQDFLRSGWRDWLRRAEDAWLDLRGRHERVHVAGLSMGALLALLVAARHPVSRLVLAAPAICTRDRLILLTPLLSLFVRRLERKNYVYAGDPAYAAVAERYWRYTWVAPAAQLRRLQKLARAALPSIGADCLTIVSMADKAVPPRAADIIERGMRGARRHRLTLQESGHVVVNDCEKEKVADEIIAWFGG